MTLILVLVTLTAGLVPLLLQLRQTAKALEAFALSSKKDLAQIAEDIRASRLRMNHLAGSLQTALEDLSTFTSLMGEATTSLQGFKATINTTVTSASQKLESIFKGASSVLAFFKRHSHPTQTE